MHEVKAKGILSSNNGMNLYRGCSHGCIYCDARSTCYQILHDFEDIEVKINAPLLLGQALRSKKRRCMIGTGGMSDPYIPLETSLGLTRQSLELIAHYGFGLTIQTKSNRILRDLDLLKRINQQSKCVVQMTLTTFDEELCKIVEPNVSTTKERVEVLNIMRDNGIPTVVWLCPILPFINDTRENLEGILHYCVEAKVYGIINFGMGVTLRDGDRQYFYQKLDEHFPGLRQRYISEYGDRYEISSPNHSELMRLFRSICKANGIVTDMNKLWKYLSEFPENQSGKQLTLF